MKDNLFSRLPAWRMVGMTLVVAVLALAGSIGAGAAPAYWISGTSGSAAALFAVDNAGTLTQVPYGNLQNINFIALGSDGYMYTLGIAGSAGPGVAGMNTLWRVNLASGSMDPSWTVNLGSTNTNTNMALKYGPDGNVYTTQYGHTYITQVNPVTKAITNFPLSGSIPSTSGGIAFDSTGRYSYVSLDTSSSYYCVYKYDMQNNWAKVANWTITDPGTPGQQVYGMTAGNDGNLYVANYYKTADAHSTVYRYSQSTGVWDATFSATTAANGTSTRIKDLGWSVQNGNTVLYSTSNSASLVSLNPLHTGTGLPMTICATVFSPFTLTNSVAVNNLPTMALTANVTLNNYQGDPTLVNLRVDIRDTADTTTLLTQTVTPTTPSGQTSVTAVTFPLVLPGNYLIRASAGKWLTSSTNATVTPGQTTTVNLSCLNGDLNGDNFVEDQDYSIMGIGWYQSGN